MYIVTGATGQTGSVVAGTLLKKGLPVRVTVRSEAKGERWKDLGGEIAVCDMQDARALTKAFEGGKALYLMKPPYYQSEDMFDETHKIIEAVQTALKNSSLQKLVVLSSIGAQLSSGTGVVGTLHLLEQAFKDSALPVTFVRPPSFMENWNSVLETVKNDGILPSFHHPLDAKFPQVATEDIGRVAAAAMLEATQGTQVKELAGFEYSTNDVADAFSRVLGKQVTAVAVPEDQWLDILKTFCSPRNAELMVELFRGINAGSVPFETQHRIEGRVTIADYASRALGVRSAQASS